MQGLVSRKFISALLGFPETPSISAHIPVAHFVIDEAFCFEAESSEVVVFEGFACKGNQFLQV